MREFGNRPSALIGAMRCSVHVHKIARTGPALVLVWSICHHRRGLGSCITHSPQCRPCRAESAGGEEKWPYYHPACKSLEVRARRVSGRTKPRHTEISSAAPAASHSAFHRLRTWPYIGQGPGWKWAQWAAFTRPLPACGGCVGGGAGCVGGWVWGWWGWWWGEGAAGGGDRVDDRFDYAQCRHELTHACMFEQACR